MFKALKITGRTLKAIGITIMISQLILAVIVAAIIVMAFLTVF